MKRISKKSYLKILKKILKVNFCKKIKKKKKIEADSIVDYWTLIKKGTTVSKRELNTSLPWYLHSVSIEPIFYGRLRDLFSGLVSCLDAFSTYPLARSCPAYTLPDNW